MHEKEKIRLLEKAAANNSGRNSGSPPNHMVHIVSSTKNNTAYGKNIKGKCVLCI